MTKRRALTVGPPPTRTASRPTDRAVSRSTVTPRPSKRSWLSWRAMAAMSPWTWFLGLGLMAVLAFTFPNPIILLILLFAALETYRRWKGRKAGMEGNAAYYQVTGRQRLVIGLVYLGLIVVCVLGMYATFVDRSDRI